MASCGDLCAYISLCVSMCEYRKLQVKKSICSGTLMFNYCRWNEEHRVFIVSLFTIVTTLVSKTKRA